MKIKDLAEHDFADSRVDLLPKGSNRGNFNQDVKTRHLIIGLKSGNFLT